MYIPIQLRCPLILRWALASAGVLKTMTLRILPGLCLLLYRILLLLLVGDLSLSTSSDWVYNSNTAIPTKAGIPLVAP